MHCSIHSWMHHQTECPDCSFGETYKQNEIIKSLLKEINLLKEEITHLKSIAYRATLKKRD